MIVSISGENLHRYSRWTCGVTQSGIHRCFWFPSIGGLGDIPGTYGCFRKSWYPDIIHFNRVFNYFHHPFWGFSPYFWKHPILPTGLLYMLSTDLPPILRETRGRNGTGTSLRSVDPKECFVAFWMPKLHPAVMRKFEVPMAAYPRRREVCCNKKIRGSHRPVLTAQGRI